MLLGYHFSMSLSNDITNIAVNINKQDEESSINWIYACVYVWESAPKIN